MNKTINKTDSVFCLCFVTWSTAISLLEHEAGEEGDDLLNWSVGEDVVEDELGDEQLVAAHLAGHTTLELDGLVVVHVVEVL